MTRKVVFDYKGRTYRIGGGGIEDVLNKSGLSDRTSDERERLACLGLICIYYVSWQGGGIGDIPLFAEYGGIKEKQRSLFEPAFEIISKYRRGRRS